MSLWKSWGAWPQTPGSARAPRTGFGASPKRTLFASAGEERGGDDPGPPERSFAAGCRKEHARRVRSPEFWLVGSLVCAISLGHSFAQDAVAPPATEEIVISATRFALPEEETPATVSVITAQDLEEKQTERVSDALREVPGLTVVQSGAAGQLTSVFTRGLFVS